MATPEIRQAVALIGEDTEEGLRHVKFLDWIVKNIGSKETFETQEAKQRFEDGCRNQLGTNENEDTIFSSPLLKPHCRLQPDQLADWLKSLPNIELIRNSSCAFGFLCYREYLKRVVAEFAKGTRAWVMDDPVFSILLSQKGDGPELINAISSGAGRRFCGNLRNLAAYFNVWIWADKNSECYCVHSRDSTRGDVISVLSRLGLEDKVNRDDLHSGLHMLLEYREPNI
jgi:hypothetical protein